MVYELNSAKCNVMKSECEDETQAKDPVETHELVDQGVDLAHGYLEGSSSFNRFLFGILIFFIVKVVTQMYIRRELARRYTAPSTPITPLRSRWGWSCRWGWW